MVGGGDRDPRKGDSFDHKFVGIIHSHQGEQRNVLMVFENGDLVDDGVHYVDGLGVWVCEATSGQTHSDIKGVD